MIQRKRTRSEEKVEERKVRREGEKRGREGSRFRVTDMMTIMLNTDCSLRHTQHTNRPTQEYTPAHTPHSSSYSVWLHTCTHTLCLPQCYSYLTAHIHTLQAQPHMQSLCGHRRYCANTQIQNICRWKIPDLCDVCVKLICEIIAQLSCPAITAAYNGWLAYHSGTCVISGYCAVPVIQTEGVLSLR